MKARPVKKLDPTRSLAENAARIVGVRLGELRSLAPQALKPEKRTAQHDMRIAAKRLRYILEATETCFGEEAPAARRRARDLQDILGELHDCDVMLPRVHEHIARLHAEDVEATCEVATGAPDLDPRVAVAAPNRTHYRGLEVLTVYFEARRKVLHRRFREFWAEQERKGTWDRLERAAKATLRDTRARRRALEAGVD